ncbi:MAG: sulfur carrier protein ThiS [Thermodesulfobacteriota bacterium]|nr:sulfur carrier protein ThiS [Thermodesulfobacteriota bacterium]
MKIRLNGKNLSITCSTLLDLIVHQNLDQKAVVAEYNYKVVKQDDWEKVKINNGDNIELLSFVGGG